MKQTACFFLALLLLCCFIPQARSQTLPASAQAAAALSPTPAETRLLNDWEASLAAAEDLYAKLEWALDYVDEWIARNTWENLSKAKAACILLKDYTDGKTIPALSLSRSEQAELAAMGYELQILTDYGLLFDIINDVLVPTVTDTIHPLLEEDAAYAYSLKTVREFSDATRETAKYYARYTQLSTNALFIPLYRQQDASDFWRTLQTSYPTVFRNCDKWCSEHAKLEKTARKHAANTDEPLNAAYERAQSRVQNMIADLTQGRKPKTLAIKGAPDRFPFPEWYDPSMAVYTVFRVNRDGSRSYPVCGQKLTAADCCILVQQSGITLRQVQDYVALLLGPENVDPSETHWSLKNDGGTELDIEWKNQTVTFRFPGESTCFLPLDLF